MAYILQHRRDTQDNWSSVNPVLADAEIGFILDLDETGKQKSSLYKIGDGATAWNNLPLFGFGGNVYNTFSGNDLDISVASRQAVLDKINEIVTKASTELNSALSAKDNEIINGSADLEGLVNKLSTSQLVQLITPEPGETFGDKTYTREEPLTWEDVEPTMRNQIVSRWALLEQLQGIWNDFGAMEDRQLVIENTHSSFVNDTYTPFVTLTESQLKTLQDFATVFGEFKDEFSAATEETLSSHATTLDEHSKFIEGWDEQTGVGEDEQPIITHHKGVDEKIGDVNTKADSIDAKVDALRTELLNRHQVVTEQEFARLDFSSYPEGTLFYTYKVQQ